MKSFPGRVRNGFVILEGGHTLPEGAFVTVSWEVPEATPKPRKKGRVEFPLVRSKHPGRLRLTGQRIAEILDEEDAPPRR